LIDIRALGEKIKGKGETELSEIFSKLNFTGQEMENGSEFWSALTPNTLRYRTGVLMQKNGTFYEIINI